MSFISIYEREIDELEKRIVELEQDKVDCLESINKLQKRMDEAIKIALSTSNTSRRKTKAKLAEDLNKRLSKGKEHLAKIEKSLAEKHKALLEKENKLKKISA
jgi:chromosome segregation ATPase